MIYLSGAYDVLFLPEFSSNLQTLALWSLGIEVYWYDFFLRIPSCSSEVIQELLDHYVWIDVGSIMFMSGEASFIVWVDWNAGSVSSLCPPINPSNARFDNQIAFAQCCLDAGPVLQTNAHHWANLECLLWTLVTF